MKRRLRFIFSLLALCLLGTYGFQAYWLYGGYQLAQAEFARTVREALAAVVQQQQVAHTQKTFNIKFNDYAELGTPPGRAPRWQIESLDTGLAPLPARRRRSSPGCAAASTRSPRSITSGRRDAPPRRPR